MSNERLPVTGSDLDDLDLPSMEAYVSTRAPSLVEAGSLEEAAVRLGLMAKAAPRFVPTSVGLLAFGRVPAGAPQVLEVIQGAEGGVEHHPHRADLATAVWHHQRIAV